MLVHMQEKGLQAQANNITSSFTMTIACSSPISLEPIVLEAHFDITVSHHSVLALVFVLLWLAACGDYLMAVVDCLQLGHPAKITLRGITLGGPAISNSTSGPCTCIHH